MTNIRPSRPRDAIELAPKLREADVQDIKVVTGETPLTALQRGLEGTVCFTAELDGEAVAMFGYADDNQGGAVIWFLSTEVVVQRPIEFVKTARRWLNWLNQKYHLYNWIHKDNEKHIRWLAREGFTFFETDKQGVCTFFRRQPCVPR